MIRIMLAVGIMASLAKCNPGPGEGLKFNLQQGKTYHYCYDRGYLPLENDWFLVVRKKETRD